MTTHHPTAADATIDDPFLLDNEHIEALADPGRIRAGLQLSTDHVPSPRWITMMRGSGPK